VTDDERNRAIRAALDSQDDKLAAWLAKPVAEQTVMLDKIAYVRRAQGVLAARRMMEALGFPMIQTNYATRRKC